MPKKSKSQEKIGELMNVESLISMAVSTGKTHIGARVAEKESRGSKAVAFVISENCPEDTRKSIEHNASFSKVPIIRYTKSSQELGAVIGRPHRVAVITIYDPGNSRILEITNTG